MMSKTQRWQETLVHPPTQKPSQKTGGKEQAVAVTAPASGGGKQAGSSVSKPNVAFGRSLSLPRGSDLTASGTKTGGTKAGGSLNRGSVGHQSARQQAPRPARTSFRLCSSRSFSSLNTSSLTTAPFMRSSRSLNRLDQRSSREDLHHPVPKCSCSQVKKGQTTEKKVLNSTSEEQLRDQCHGDDAENMKTSSSSRPLVSLVSTTACDHHCHDLNTQTRDGVSTLCAVTSGMKRNLVQAVLKNVQPSLTDVSSSLSEQPPDPQSADNLDEAEYPNSFFHEQKNSDFAEETHQQQTEQEPELQPEREQSPAECSPSSMSSPSTLSSPVSPSPSSAPSPTAAPPQHGDQGEAGETDASSCVDGAGGDGSTSTTTLSNDECFDDKSNVQVKILPESKEQLKVREWTKVIEKLPFEQQKTGLLVKELEQTQKELSRLRQLNRNLQAELQQERESHWRNNHLSNSSTGQASAVQRLQKMNHDLRLELEARTTSQEEAREAELRRRVDLLAQQAQVLVTGDATALAQAHLEQDRVWFHEQRLEWEHCVASLKSQLGVSEEHRREAEERSTKLQQELQGFHCLQGEADRLQKHLKEVTTQLHAHQEAQAQKESRLQKHLTLLQESQDRERRRLVASLKQAEQHSLDLQERLDQAEEEVGSLIKTEAWSKEIEKAQQQLQEELACTVSAVEKLQEEREQLDRSCQDLQNQLSEADGEVGRLQSRLKTDETQYYNLEHAYERVCEELQVALGQAQQREGDTQEIREGYERLLDRKEQELSEVLLKMEVLGNSLEETEVKLNEVLKVCTCSSSTSSSSSSSSLPGQQKERQQQPMDPLTQEVTESDQLSNGYHSTGSAGDDAERFMSVIQTLETKLYATEEKLRDILQSLEESQSHVGCQDPHVCSELTQSRASNQHLSLLLHSQAKQSQRFSLETENRCRTLAGRFQVALNITQACRERLKAIPLNINDFEKQLATIAACLQQGEADAMKQQHESRNASKGVDKILDDQTLAGAEGNVRGKGNRTNTLPPEDETESLGKSLMRELFVLDKMMSVLQSQHSVSSIVSRAEEGGVACRYKRVIAQRIALKTEKCAEDEPLEEAIGRVCAEAELIYSALKLQQQYESVTQVNKQAVEHERGDLADVSPSELFPYEDESDDKKVKAKKETDWLERFVSRLQRRAKCLRQLCQEISDGDAEECSMDHDWENSSAANLKWMQDQARWIYLSDRLYLDLEQEMQQCEVLQGKLQALCQEEDFTLNDEQEAFNQTIFRLQEDNSALREELERADQKIKSVETGHLRLLDDTRKIKDYHEGRMKNLETAFQEKIRDLQHIHEEEMKHLQCYYTKSGITKEKQTKPCPDAPSFSERTSSLIDQTAMERKTKEKLGNRMAGGDEASMRKAYQKDLGASCDEGFTVMEEMHRYLIGDLQQQHQKEVVALLKEKDQLLQEETAATLSAIAAMRRAHKQELEKSRRSQQVKETADITQLHIEHDKGIQSLHKELEVLSVQHTQKCLENSQLNQELKELKRKQRDTDEMSELHHSLNGKQPHVAPQLNDFYEMEVILRAREAEMQYLRQEGRALREELKLARMDKIYAQKKLKTLYTNSPDEPHHDGKFATWSPGRHASGQSLQEDTGTNMSNAVLQKKTDKSSLTRLIRGGRSKRETKESLSVQERMKLFDSV